MVTNKIDDRKFDWGDAVRVIDDAPMQYKNIAFGSVCGIRNIGDSKISEVKDLHIGSFLYLIEGPNGDSIEIPEKFLEKI